MSDLREKDDPSIIEKALQERTRLEFIRFCMGYHPAADMYHLGAAFALSKVNEAITRDHYLSAMAEEDGREL